LYSATGPKISAGFIAKEKEEFFEIFTDIGFDGLKSIIEAELSNTNFVSMILRMLLLSMKLT
jgi:hypothetical protein